MLNPRNELFIIAIFLVAIVVGVFTQKAIAASDSIRITCDIWAPYQIAGTDGQVTGFSLEVTKSVLSKMNIAIESVDAYPWKRALSTLEAGNADALFSANFTEDRTAFARYPEEVLVDSPWLIWTHGAEKFHSLEDLKGKRIGVVLGYSYTEEFWTFIETYCVVERVFSDKTNFKKLDIGRLDAIIAEFGNGYHITNDLGLKDIYPNWNLEVKRDGLYVIFNKKKYDEEFVAKFSDELRRFKETVQYRNLEEKYFGRSH